MVDDRVACLGGRACCLVLGCDVAHIDRARVDRVACLGYKTKGRAFGACFLRCAVREVGHLNGCSRLRALRDMDCDGRAFRGAPPCIGILVDDLALFDGVGVVIGDRYREEAIVLVDGGTGFAFRESDKVRDILRLRGLAAEIGDGRIGSDCHSEDCDNDADSDIALVLRALLLLLCSFGPCRLLAEAGRAARDSRDRSDGTAHLLGPAGVVPAHVPRLGAADDRGCLGDSAKPACEVVPERVEELVCCLEAVLRVLLHALQDDGLKGRIDVRIDLAGRNRLLLHLLDSDRDCVIAVEGDTSCCCLVHDDAEGIEVGGGPELLALRLLGRDIVGRSQNRVVGREMAVLGAGDAEVHDLDVAIRLDHDVLRLDVAVDDVVLVGDGERLGNLGADLCDLAAVQRSVLPDAVLQVRAAQVLHDDVIGVPILAPVIDRDDIGALERCRCLCLLLEAGSKRRVCCVLGQHGLDSDSTAEDLVKAAVHCRHSACADLVLDRIAATENSVCHI